ncbi:lytic murein transglycosylase [Roseococcus pinisoli]|uniref:Lytic murein transglycosylase n=1 Tax=Roseococcus pinisoli TaxID=2835040 RepID=A0ABS5QF13_9PROT|nr:lytic murein transglycosylase [Roseococcus pinisoli]MBS7811520.1 lytic murein transglycosylase [Roseococcus pinisoli]
MFTRRFLPACSLGLAATPALVRNARGQGSFSSFLDGVRTEARRNGVSANILNQAFANLQPNDRVLELDRRQAEFTQTWPQYRDARLSQTRIDAGRRAYAENRALLQAIEARFRVSSRIVVAIWGMETNYGSFTGNFNVIEALATLAWEGRRATFFRAELMAALRILDAGHVRVDRMRGSYAGAMGQPQFMPTSFERMAVDFDGDGRRDIWDNKADALGSIANYLARSGSGWREGEIWGFEVQLPGRFDTTQADHRQMRAVAEWARMGVTRTRGSLPQGGDWAIVIPGLSRGDTQAFMVGQNFMQIRRYNPSNFYATAVGLLSDRVA